MSPEAARRGDGVRLVLDEFEVELLRTLQRAIRAVLEEPDADDGVVTRLFPRCVPDDEEIDAEVRALIFDDLLAARLEALDEFVAILERGSPHRGRLEVDLVSDEPALVLGVLNDLRLALGARVGIEHLDRSEVDADHPAAQTLAVMDHLAWMQDEILRVVDPPSVGEGWPPGAGEP